MALSFWPPRRRGHLDGGRRRLFFRKLRTTILVCAALLAVFPPLFFHLRLRRFHQMLDRKCHWLYRPPLVCGHGGDSSLAFPNTVDTPCLLSLLFSFCASSSSFFFPQMDAFRYAIRSQVHCIEVDVSRSSDGVLFALHSRFLSSSFLFLNFWHRGSSSSSSHSVRDLQLITRNSSVQVGHLTSKQVFFSLPPF